jgi:superfamily II DNA/RNA helicase
MLRAEFQDAIQEILRDIPKGCQVALFSATLPPETLDLTNMFMKDPLRITLNREDVLLKVPPILPLLPFPFSLQLIVHDAGNLAILRGCG